MMEQLLELDYFRPTAIEFYKQYAAASEVTPKILEGMLSNALGRIYKFAEEE